MQPNAAEIQSKFFVSNFYFIKLTNFGRMGLTEEDKIYRAILESPLSQCHENKVICFFILVPLTEMMIYKVKGVTKSYIGRVLTTTKSTWKQVKKNTKCTNVLIRKLSHEPFLKIALTKKWIDFKWNRFPQQKTDPNVTKQLTKFTKKSQKTVQNHSKLCNGQENGKIIAKRLQNFQLKSVKNDLEN